VVLCAVDVVCTGADQAQDARQQAMMDVSSTKT
jgi:hypothetical protein